MVKIRTKSIESKVDRLCNLDTWTATDSKEAYTLLEKLNNHEYDEDTWDIIQAQKNRLIRHIDKYKKERELDGK